MKKNKQGSTMEDFCDIEDSDIDLTEKIRESDVSEDDFENDTSHSKLCGRLFARPIYIPQMLADIMILKEIEKRYVI